MTIDPNTGKPRKGKWVNRIWVPEEPRKWPILPQSNPDFDPDSRFGLKKRRKMKLRKKVKSHWGKLTQQEATEARINKIQRVRENR